VPVTYVIDKEHRLILTIGEGSVTASEIRNHQDRLLRDPNFDATFNQLIDVTTATAFDMTADEAKQIALRPIVSEKSKRAFVAVKPDIYGLGRLMQIYHVQMYHERLADAGVFSDRDSALKWLEIKEDSGHY
jgi:glucose-6-phosphate isomerase